METYNINRMSLYVFDDKKFVLIDGIHKRMNNFIFIKTKKKEILTDDHKKDEIQEFFRKKRGSRR